MLQTMVDPSIKGIAIAMFMFTSSIIGSTSGIVIGALSKQLDLKPGDPATHT